MAMVPMLLQQSLQKCNLIQKLMLMDTQGKQNSSARLQNESAFLMHRE
jgi:hypothetical protein